jgi:GH24 family phage-related lysozyme (muramidase)
MPTQVPIGAFSEKNPLDMSGLRSATSEQDWNNIFYGQMEAQSRLAGNLPVSQGLFQQTAFPTDPTKASQQLTQSVASYAGPKAFDQGNDQDYMSQRFNFIAQREGFVPHMYMLDGVPHIGFGTNLKAHGGMVKRVLGWDDKKYNDMMSGRVKITENDGRKIFESQISMFEKVVDDKLGGVPLSKQQRVALVSMAYNSPALIGPGITAAIKNKDWGAVSWEILQNSNANKIAGLQTRRRLEHDMFFGQDPTVTAFSKRYAVAAAEPKDSYVKRFSDGVSTALTTVLGIKSAHADEIVAAGPAVMSAADHLKEIRLAEKPDPTIVADTAKVVQEAFSNNLPTEDQPIDAWLAESGVPMQFPKEVAPETYKTAGVGYGGGYIPDSPQLAQAVTRKIMQADRNLGWVGGISSLMARDSVPQHIRSTVDHFAFNAKSWVADMYNSGVDWMQELVAKEPELANQIKELAGSPMKVDTPLKTEEDLTPDVKQTAQSALKVLVAMNPGKTKISVGYHDMDKIFGKRLRNEDGSGGMYISEILGKPESMYKTFLHEQKKAGVGYRALKETDMYEHDKNGKVKMDPKDGYRTPIYTPMYREFLKNFTTRASALRSEILGGDDEGTNNLNWYQQAALALKTNDPALAFMLTFGKFELRQDPKTKEWVLTDDFDFGKNGLGMEKMRSSAKWRVNLGRI